ncbi:MAG: hypothetical protein U9N02_02500 [Campylobacterota bacterium]|nr:hypothetical protein [Campylobacterota bacterium]
MQIIKSLAVGFLLTIIYWYATTLPLASQNRVENIKINISKTEKDYNQFESIYIKRFTNLSPEIQKMALKGRFIRDLSDAKKIITENKLLLKQLNELLEKNEKSSLELFNNLINKVNKNLKHSKNKITKGKKELLDFVTIVEESETVFKNNKQIIKELYDVINNNKSFIKNALKDHPKKQSQIISIETILNEKELSLKKLENSLNNNYSKKQYFEILNDINMIASIKKEIETFIKDKINPIGKLYKNYTKILMDMKVNYFYVVGRASWDEYSDSSYEKTYTYKKIPTTKTIYDKLSTHNGLVASGSLRGLRTTSVWRYVKPSINLREKISYGDSHAEFWIEGLPAKFYHKYTIIEGNNKIDSDWIEVDEKYYIDNFANLGMEIYSKPYGYFENEAITTASPAGMSYVGNPHYGEWKQDNSGGSFWFYYSMYSMFNNNYSRSEYDNYRKYSSKRESYYGTNNRYGTYSKQTMRSNRFRNSSFSRRNKEFVNKVKSGSKNMRSKMSNSIRGIGSSSRGRGASGGGK